MLQRNGYSNVTHQILCKVVVCLFFIVQYKLRIGATEYFE